MTDENAIQSGLTQSLLPNWDTDHGSFNFGDLLILIFDGILLLYTGWRSFDLLSGTVPNGWEIMAFIGLLALDFGAVIWSYIWIFNSTTDWQDRIAMIFFVVDMTGVALTSITDSLLYGDNEGVVFTMLEPIAMLLIPIIIFGNVIAGIVYHFASDETRIRRSTRRMKANARREEQRQTDEELQLAYAQQSLLRRQAELPRKVALANLKIAQDQIEKGAMQILLGTGDVERGSGQQGHHLTSFPSVDVSNLAAKGNGAESVTDMEKALAELQVAGADGASLPIDTTLLPAGGGIGAGSGNGAKPDGASVPPFYDVPTYHPELSFDAAPKTEAYAVYFRTNSPNNVVSIKTDGTGFKVAHPIEGLRFITPSPIKKEIVWEIKDKLTPRGFGKGDPAQGYRVNQQGEPDRFLEIADWSVVALQPDDNINPTEAGAES